MYELLRDLRYSFRMMIKDPGFTLVAVGTIALALGANTVVFSVIDGVLLRPLRYQDPDRLVAVFAAWKGRDEFQNPTSPAGYLDWKEQSQTLERMTAAHPWSATLTGVETPSLVSGLKTTYELFQLLGVSPLLGRTYLDRDESAGLDNVWLILGRGLKLSILGMVAGFGLTLLVSRALASRLYGISATDPPTLAAVAFFLLFVASLASYFPARRAAKLDPMVALRHQ